MSTGRQGWLYAAFILVATAASAYLRESWPVAAAVVLGLALVSVAAGKVALTLANGLTGLRLLAAASLALIPAQAGLVACLVAAGVFVLDGVDGAIARRRGTASAFGAELDKECDAAFVMLVSLRLWLVLGLGPWIVIVGLWRYFYSLLVAFGPRMQTAPRSSWARYCYSVSSVAMLLAMLVVPLKLPHGALVATGLCVLAVTLISASFVRGIYYSYPRQAESERR